MKIGRLKQAFLYMAALVVAASPLLAPVPAGATDENPVQAVKNGTAIDVSWTPVENATSYEVTPYVDGTAKTPATTGEVYYVQFNTVPNTSYAYKVTATVEAEEPPIEEPGEEPGDETPPEDEGEEEPSAPVTVVEVGTSNTIRYGFTTLKASAKASYNSVKLSYSNVYGVKNYQIYRSTHKTKGFKLIKTTSATSYTNTSLKLGATYYYKVRGYQTTATKTYYTNWSSTLSARTKLAAPSLKVLGANQSSAKLGITKVAGGTSYKIYRSTHKSKGFKHIKTTGASSYTNTKLKYGKRYYYKTVVYRGKTKGSTSKTISVVVGLKAPASVKVTGGASSATVSWSKSSGAKYYKVYRATSKSGSYTHVKTTTGSSYKNTGLSPDKTYYYKVKAYGTLGKKTVASGYSAVASATTYQGEGGFQATADSWWVLETSGEGLYMVCYLEECDPETDALYMQNRAYVFAEAGQYVIFFSDSGKGKVTKLENYRHSEKMYFTKAGDYMVGGGLDLTPGEYAISGTSEFMYMVCRASADECDEWVDFPEGNGGPEGSPAVVTLEEGDFFVIWGDDVSGGMPIGIG